MTTITVIDHGMSLSVLYISSGFELTTLVVIGADCVGNCKSNCPYDDGP
jgi:hypothetical protein